MLDEFLKVAYEKKAARQQGDEFLALMRQLPEEELHKIAQSGQIKSAFHADCGLEWLENFKGTPLFEAAMQLEQESIQAEVAQQQQSEMQRQSYASQDSARDQLRLKRRLLELQLMQQEAGAAGASPPQAGDAPSAPAPSGANAPAVEVKTAEKKHNPDESADEQGAGAVATPLDKGDSGPQKIATDFQKAAFNMGMLRSVGQGALSLAKQHPGAAIGAGLGAVHGLTREGGGVGAALGEGLIGGAAGHGLQQAAGAMGMRRAAGAVGGARPALPAAQAAPRLLGPGGAAPIEAAATRVPSPGGVRPLATQADPFPAQRGPRLRPAGASPTDYMARGLPGFT